jgi:O-antigen ligase
MNRYRFDLAGAGLRIEHFVCAGVALGWFLRVRPEWKQLGFSRADLILVAYLGLALLSSLTFAPVVRESLKFFGLMAFGVGLYLLVRAIGSLSLGSFALGVISLIVVGVAASLFGIAAWVVYPMGLNLGVQVYTLDNFTTHSPFGTLFDSNTLGLYAMGATLMQVTLLVDTQFLRWRGWLAAGTLITLVAVALSLTRAAWLGLVVGLFLVLLSSPRRRFAIAVGGAALALVIVALVANSALAGGGGALAEFSVARVLTSRSIFFRLDAYARAWNDFVASPILGNGVNVFAQNHVSPAGGRDWISNFFLMTLHDTGVVGLALLLGWLGWLAAETWRALKAATGTRRTFLLALAIAYVALFITYQATTVFWLGWNWVYLGLVRAGGRISNN